MAYVDHPIRNLAHAQTSGMAELLFLLLAGVWMIRVAMEPGLEIVGGLLWQFAAFFGGTVDECRGWNRLGWAGRGRGGGGEGGWGRWLGRGQGSRGGSVGRVGQDEFLIRKGPFIGLCGIPSILLGGDAVGVDKHVLLADGRVERRVADVFVLEWCGEGRVRARAGYRGRGPVVVVDVVGVAQIRGCERRHGRGCTRKRGRGIRRRIRVAVSEACWGFV